MSLNYNIELMAGLYKQKLDYVDSLRGLAILGVVIVHCSLYGARLPTTINHIVSQGAKGVQLFFITSAFTLFLSMSQNDKKKVEFVDFYIRRLFRIAPMYWLAILYYAWQNLMPNKPFNIHGILMNFLFIHGLNPENFNSVVPGGWSIGVEMLFYLFVPTLFTIVKTFNQAVLFTFFSSVIHASICIIVLLLYPELMNDNTHEFYINHYLISSLPVFGMGFVAFFAVSFNVSMLKLLPLFCIVLIISYVLNSIGLDFIYLLVSFLFIILVILLSQGHLNLLNNELFIYIGKISFSLYLVHFAVLHWLDRCGYANIAPTSSSLLNFLIRTLTVLLISIPIARFFYNKVEVPMQAVGRQIFQKDIR